MRVVLQVSELTPGFRHGPVLHRSSRQSTCLLQPRQLLACATLLIQKWWRGVDLNHRSLTTTDLQSVPFGHSGTPPHYLTHFHQGVVGCDAGHRAFTLAARGYLRTSPGFGKFFFHFSGKNFAGHGACPGKSLLSRQNTCPFPFVRCGPCTGRPERFPWRRPPA